MPSLAPDEQAAFNRLVTTLEHHEDENVSRSLDLAEMRPRQAIAAIAEMCRLQEQVIRKLFEKNREGLLEAVRQCSDSMRIEIVGIMLIAGKIDLEEAARILWQFYCNCFCNVDAGRPSFS